MAAITLAAKALLGGMAIAAAVVCSLVLLLVAVQLVFLPETTDAEDTPR